MKKIIITMGMAVFAASYAGSATLTPVRAVDAAVTFRSHTLKTRASVDAKVERTWTSPDGNPLYGVAFGHEGGFVLITGDDESPKVIGYADSGHVDFNNPPAAFAEMMRLWLAMADNSEEAGETNEDKRAPIPPLMSTQWDQTGAYASLTSNGHPTGCVATAMAQVMKCHRYPAKSQGSAVWNWDTVRFDSEYRWDAMLDTYQTSGNPAGSVNAVAQLMVDCGKSVDMHYTSDMSGAMTYNVPGAMRDNFGYDPAIAFRQKGVYNISDWIDLLYRDLRLGSPVIYGGFGAGYRGGHQFVVDGYEKGGYFHVNWGWSGVNDGFYLLDNLSPGSGGVGGGSYTFNVGCDAVMHIRKPIEGSAPDREIISCGNFNRKATSGTVVTFSSDDGYLYNESASGFVTVGGNDFNADLGVRLINCDNPADSKTVPSVEGPRKFVRWAPGCDSFSVDFAGIADGSYYVFPMSKASDSESWLRVKGYQNRQQYVVAILRNGKPVAFKQPGISSTQFRPIEAIFTDYNAYKVSENGSIALNPLVLPAGATGGIELEYASSNAEVATVDANGNVKGIKAGKATITCSAKDGSGIAKSIAITVGGQGSAVENIFGEGIDADSITVFDLTGRCILKNAAASEFSTLQKGIYIVNNKKVIKQ